MISKALPVVGLLFFPGETKMKKHLTTVIATLLFACTSSATAADDNQNKAKAAAKQEKAEAAVRITLGPNVEHVTATSAVIHWATDRVAANQVKYRSGKGEWKNAFKRQGSKDHYAKLTGLTPDSTVEYQILTRDGDVRKTGDFKTAAK